MRKIFKAGICTMAAMMLLTGCSKNSVSTTGAETTGSEATGSEAESTEAMETEAYVAESSIKLGKYKGVAIKMEKAEVSDAELDAQLEQILSANSEHVEVDREAKNGDTVNIDYKGLLDGEAFDGGTDEGYDLILGSGNFIDGFEEGLIGVKKGDKKDLNLKFPENYTNADLSGKEVVFEVTVNAVKEASVPKLTDEFVQGLSTDDKTVEEFKNNLRKSILEQKNYQIERQRNMDLIDAIMNDSEITVATEAVEAEYDKQLKSYTDQATMYGMDLAALASMYGMDENGFKSEIRAVSKDSAGLKLIYAEIAKLENIAVTDEDRTELAKANGYDTVDALIAAYDKEIVEEAALSQKILDFLVENAEITEETKAQ